MMSELWFLNTFASNDIAYDKNMYGFGVYNMYMYIFMYIYRIKPHISQELHLQNHAQKEWNLLINWSMKYLMR